MINTQVAQLEAANRPDPLLSFKWVCSDATLPFGLPCHYLEAIEMPWENVQSSPHNEAGRQVHYPGQLELSGLNITLYEDQKGTAMKWITDWKRKVRDPDTNFYGLPYGVDGFKQKMSISLLDTKNNEIMTVLLRGIWPEATSAWSLNYTDSGRLVVSQSLAIDKQMIFFPVR